MVLFGGMENNTYSGGDFEYQNAVWFRHIAHTPLAEFNMYIPPEIVNIVIIWRFSVYIFRQINSSL